MPDFFTYYGNAKDPSKGYDVRSGQIVTLEKSGMFSSWKETGSQTIGPDAEVRFEVLRDNNGGVSTVNGRDYYIWEEVDRFANNVRALAR